MSKTNGLRERMLGYLQANWDQADPRFRRWCPNQRYRFRSADLAEMAELVTPAEAFLLAVVIGQRASRMKAADDLRLPYALVDWLCKRPAVLKSLADSEVNQK